MNAINIMLGIIFELFLINFFIDKKTNFKVNFLILSGILSLIFLIFLISKTYNLLLINLGIFSILAFTLLYNLIPKNKPFSITTFISYADINNLKLFFNHSIY